jgi:integrase/recombinase XerD
MGSTAREGSHAYHTGSADRDRVGHALRPVGATTVQPDLPSRLRALLAERQSDEDLIARFLLGYRDRTRAAYRADLRDFRAWCVRIRIGLLDVRRSHIEAYTRQLEQAGHSRASLARRLATLTGFYRYAVQEGTLPHFPVAHVRRPSMARDSQTLGLDREEAVRFLAAAQAASTRDHALACLLTLNGLRVSEACAAEVVDLGVERAHRVLAVIGKGGQRTLVPLAPRTVRAIDAALGGRTDGPLLVSNTGGRLDRHDAARIVARLARRAGLTKHITPHSMRHTMVTLALDAGVSLRDVQDAARHADPRTTRRTTVRAMPLTATPPIPWRRSSQKCSPPPPARTNPTRLPYIPG